MDAPLPSRLLQTHRIHKRFWADLDRFREMTKPCSDVFVDSALLYEKGAWVFGLDAFDRPGVDRKGIIRSVMLLAALGAWRPTQDIVAFDDSVYRALIESDFGPSIPTEILSRFPAWSLWFDTPYGFSEPDGKGGEICWKGFFATTDGDGSRLELMFVDDDFDEMGVTSKNMFLQLGEAAEVRAAVLKMRDTFGDSVEVRDVSAPGGMDCCLARAVSLLAYVCSHGFLDRPGALSRPSPRPSPTKTKKGWRVFPAPRPTERKLGMAIAEKVARAAFEAGRGGRGAGGIKRPHVRRAHWHGYWLGPLEGERTLDVRWMPPIAVASRNARKDALEDA